jgi:polyhydroxyalkanoate synthase
MERKHMESATDLVTSIGKFYVQAFAQPMTALGGSLAASREMLKSLAGQSEIEPDKSDKRFKDPVWTSNPGYRFLVQSYLAWSRAITGWVDGLGVPERDKLRVKLLANLVTDAMAPTNALLTNPTAMKATLDAGGQNLVAGLQHFMHDMVANNGLPSMVDKSGSSWAKTSARQKARSSMPRITWSLSSMRRRPTKSGRRRSSSCRRRSTSSISGTSPPAGRS